MSGEEHTTDLTYTVSISRSNSTISYPVLEVSQYLARFPTVNSVLAEMDFRVFLK